MHPPTSSTYSTRRFWQILSGSIGSMFQLDPHESSGCCSLKWCSPGNQISSRWKGNQHFPLRSWGWQVTPFCVKRSDFASVLWSFVFESFGSRLWHDSMYTWGIPLFHAGFSANVVWTSSVLVAWQNGSMAIDKALVNLREGPKFCDCIYPQRSKKYLLRVICAYVTYDPYVWLQSLSFPATPSCVEHNLWPSGQSGGGCIDFGPIGFSELIWRRIGQTPSLFSC